MLLFSQRESSLAIEHISIRDKNIKITTGDEFRRKNSTRSAHSRINRILVSRTIHLESRFFPSRGFDKTREYMNMHASAITQHARCRQICRGYTVRLGPQRYSEAGSKIPAISTFTENLVATQKHSSANINTNKIQYKIQRSSPSQ